MLQTKNHLNEKIRMNIVSVLQRNLFSAIDLAMQAKQAHWNVRGEPFIALHELFDKIHEQFENSADLMAERIAQLGDVVDASIKSIGEHTALPVYPFEMTDYREHIEALTNSMSEFGKNIHDAIDRAMRINDHVSADMLTEISRMLDKNLWFVESHLVAGKKKISLV